MRPWYFAFAVLLAGVPAAFSSSIPNSACEISVSPAATLLLPYFEVEIEKPVNDAANTIFTVVNVSRAPRSARITIWSDYGYPVFWFNIYLTGFDAQPISLYDVLARGVIPQTSSSAVAGGRSSRSAPSLQVESCDDAPGAVPKSLLAAMQAALTTGVRESSECRVGSMHPFAAGYVTIDLVNSCSTLSPLDMSYYSQVLAHDNVLTGDYEHVFPDRERGNFAGGSPLVHIRSVAADSVPATFYDRYTPPGARRIDRRQPLPSTFAARFVQGGPTQLMTDLVLWREGGSPSPARCASANAALSIAQIIRFDEDENATSTLAAASASSPASSSIATSSPVFPPPATGSALAGWMILDLNNSQSVVSSTNPYSTQRASQNWLVVRMRAEGRYGIDYDAMQLGGACAGGSIVSTLRGGK